MRDQILAFYTGGPSWPPPEDANKSARDKKPDRDSICKSCRTVIPPGDAVCPGCGKPREVRTYGGAGSRLERVDGTLKLIDSVTGAASAYGGDLWPEVCTEALLHSRHMATAVRAEKNALGRPTGPSRDELATGDPVSLTPLGRDLPDPAVIDLMRRNFQAWIISRKASQGARA